MAAKTTKFDIIEHLHDQEAVATYLDAALEDGDPAVIAAALGDVARARGMTKVASEAGVTREALYKALSENGDPRLTTLLGVTKALGVRLSIVTDDEHAA